MRFIHTADWHLGNQMHDIDRRAENKLFLDWLKEEICRQKADALVVSGDIFDTSNPPVEARKMYEDFLASLNGTCCKTIVITGGNHDSASLLESSGKIMELLNIFVVGTISAHSPKDMVVPIKAKDGNVSSLCLAVPFVREPELRKFLSEHGGKSSSFGEEEGESASLSEIKDSEFYSVGYRCLYDEVLKEAEKINETLPKKVPVIALGHFYASDLEGRESMADSSDARKYDDGVRSLDVVGNLGFVPPSVFSEKIDYVALGHIHYSSMVAKNPKIRYSGSPFVMGFDEAKIPRYVLSVEISDAPETGTSVDVQKIPVPSAFEFKRISGTLSEIKTELSKLPSLSSGKAKKEQLTLFDAEHLSQTPKPLFLELCYKKEIGVNASDYLEDEIKNLPPNVTVASWKIMTSAEARSFGFEDYDEEEVKNLSDEEIFTQLILTRAQLDKDSDEAKKVLSEFLPIFLEAANACDAGISIGEDENDGGEN